MLFHTTNCKAIQDHHEHIPLDDVDICDFFEVVLVLAVEARIPGKDMGPIWVSEPVVLVLYWAVVKKVADKSVSCAPRTEYSTVWFFLPLPVCASTLVESNKITAKKFEMLQKSQGTVASYHACYQLQTSSLKQAIKNKLAPQLFGWGCEGRVQR